VTTTIPDLANRLEDLARLALQFGRVDRAVYHEDQTTPESDTDHTVMLGWVACALAATWYPQLDLGLVAQFALVHDAPEVYAGDTPTLRITDAERAAKAAREDAAVDRLTAEFARQLSWFPNTLRRYEQQQLPEARFVRGVDKILPKLACLIDRCAGLLKQGISRAELVAALNQQRHSMNGYVGEFTELMELWEELACRVLERPELDNCPGCTHPAGEFCARCVHFDPAHRVHTPREGAALGGGGSQ
jgi:5'-deoxynucleotidase YfbR-like HD superfamily hydrolase